MSFLEKIERARAFLERNRRVSLRVLKREFDLDEDTLHELVDELVTAQKVAVREGKVLVWADPRRDEITADVAEDTLARVGTEPERRQLTVMFCDLVESTGLVKRLGAEDFRDVLRAYQEATASVVERYEGHVAQYLGDGILVYFGYPQAHEDDAELAVRTGRDILVALDELNQRIEPEYGMRLAVRVGIHTGGVVIGDVGRRGRMETLALGETTHIAARLETLAEPDSVVISGATLRLVQGIFVTRDLGTPPLKGVAEPIQVYMVLRATGVRRRFPPDPSRLTPLVGRDQELGELLERKDLAREGEGGGVLITGGAGLGKSRLLQAFHERLAEEPHTWLECHCTPYARGTAFFPLIEILEQALRFGPGDSEGKLRDLERAVKRAGLPVQEVVPLIAPVLLLPLPDRYPSQEWSPEVQHKKTLEAIVSWFLALAEEQLLVVVFEDLQWCDSSTLKVVTLLIEQSAKSKVLTSVTFRPDFKWQGPAHSNVTQLEVARLRRQQAENLVSSMNRSLVFPPGVVERIVERADGVPLFLEELTKMVLESGIVEEREGRLALVGDLETLAIPTTLQGSLMARLDRLSATRDVAQRTAALGRSFSYALAAASLGFDEETLQRGLARLVEADILHQQGEPPNADYLYKHALLQEAAYESLLRQRRKQLHGSVVDALLDRFSEQVATAPELVARHAEAAARTDIAIEYYRRAGSYAQLRCANEEAVVHFGKAIELLGPDDGPERDRLELSLQLALGASLTAVRGYAHPERRVAYERARVLGESVKDPTLLGRALIGVSISECTSGAMETAHSVAARVLANAEEMLDDELRLHGHSQVALPEYYQGRFESSLEHCKRAIDLYDPPRHHKAAYLIGGDTGFSAMGVSAWNLWHLGYPDQALAQARETVELAQRFEDSFGLGFSTMVQGTIHWLRGEFEAQEQVAATEIAIGEEWGFPVWLGLGKAIHAAARVALGNATAVSELAEGIALVAETGTQAGGPMLLAMVAATQATAGSFEEALSAVDLALAVSAATGQAFQDAELHRLKGELTITAKREDTLTRERIAEESFRKAAQIARTQEARSLELRALTSLARLLITQHRIPEAKALLEPAYRWFEEGLDTEDLRHARAALERLAGARAEGPVQSTPGKAR